MVILLMILQEKFLIRMDSAQKSGICIIDDKGV